MPQGLLLNVKYVAGGYGYLLSRLREVETVSNTDILVVGSSHAYRGFDPREFQADSLNMFNLGSSSQTPMQTEYLIDKYIDKLKPKTVIYEVFPATFENQGVESTLDIISNSEINIELFKAVLLNKNWETFSTFFYTIGKRIVTDLNSVQESTYYKTDKYISGGYVEKELAENTHKRGFTLKNIDLLPAQKEAFERTIQKLNEKGIKVLLIQAPITREYYDSIKNKKKIDNYFSGFQNVTYYNFNNYYYLNSVKDFYDHHHLNQRGVKDFNKELLLKLKPILKSKG
ncbi:MAG: DUF1574 domain-containing protein [Bacteroidota bacterium]|nr:DUF1574 domain-containing protein [Bacteroidota bacterium]